MKCPKCGFKLLDKEELPKGIGRPPEKASFPIIEGVCCPNCGATVEMTIRNLDKSEEVNK